MTEPSARMREDLLKQFSSADAHNPLADFKAGTMAVIKRAAEQQDHEPARAQRADRRAEGRGGQAAVRAREAARGRGRARALDRQGPALRGGGVRRDRRDRHARAATTATRSATCRAAAAARATCWSASTAAPARRGRGSCSRPRTPTCRRTGRWPSWTRRWRSATPTTPSGSSRREELLPGRGAQLREVNGDKLFVVYDPEDGSRLGLEVAYALARARMLMAKAERRRARRRRAAHRGRARAGRDGGRAPHQDAADGRGRRDRGRARMLDEMADRVRGHLEQVDALVVAGTGGDPPPQRTLVCELAATGAARPPRAARQAWRSFTAAPVRSTAPRVDPRRQRDQHRRGGERDREGADDLDRARLPERDPRRHDHRRDAAGGTSRRRRASRRGRC